MSITPCDASTQANIDLLKVNVGLQVKVKLSVKNKGLEQRSYLVTNSCLL